jgi:hypothetical protein
VFLPRQQLKLARGPHDMEHAMSQTAQTAVAVIGIDIGKNSFVGHDEPVPLCCARSGRAARWRPDLPTCRRA